MDHEDTLTPREESLDRVEPSEDHHKQGDMSGDMEDTLEENQAIGSSKIPVAVHRLSSAKQRGTGSRGSFSGEIGADSDEEDGYLAGGGGNRFSEAGHHEIGGERQDDEDHIPSDDLDDDEDDDDLVQFGSGSGGALGVYDPNEYASLNVSSEVKELFGFITAYNPQVVELETNLQVFIPEFIPAVGDIDAFIKIPRPDDVEDNLGLTVLDEPCAQQSDPTVFDLQLRALTKEGAPKEAVMKRVERADKSGKEIENWIKSISDLHRSKPATVVHYAKPMPDIDTLMQEWPSEFEELLKHVDLPSAGIDCSLEEYVDLICAVLDIPVYKSRIQALHVFFTLYYEFKNSQHFKQLADRNNMDNSEAHHYSSSSNQPDQLIL